MNIVKKIGKILLKFTGWIAGIFLLLLIICAIYINTQKTSILRYINGELQERLMGNASIKDIDISLWRHFPSISIRLKDVLFSDTVYNKPMLSAETLSSNFSLFDLLRSKKTINDISIENGAFHLVTDSNGYSNSYVLKLHQKYPAKEEKKNDEVIHIEDISVTNLDVLIEDKMTGKEFSMLINNLDASIQKKDSVMKINIEEKILMKGGLGFNLEKGAYLEKQLLEGKWEMKMNTDTRTLSFDKTNVQIEKVPIVLSGSFVMGENPNFKLTIHADRIPLSIVQAGVTRHIRNKIGKIEIQQPLKADCVVEGSLLPHMKPRVDVSWETKKNTFSIPAAAFSNCSMSGNFMNHINPDSSNDDKNSRITIPDFNGDWDGIFLTGKNIELSNLKEPDLKLSLHSDCSLEALDNKFALKNVRFIEGRADLQLFYNGPVAKDRSMLEDIEGRLAVKNGSIEYVPHNFTFTQCNGEIGFYKDSISLRKFSCRYGENKFNVEVEGKNVRRKFLVGDVSQEAVIKCYVNTPFINLGDFKPLFDGKKQRTKQKTSKKSFQSSAKRIDDMLDNCVIEMALRAADIRYQHLVAKNFTADIRFETQHWGIQNASLNLAGGSIALNGKVAHTGNNNHAAGLTAKISNVDVKKLFYGFDNFGQDAISHQHLNGNFTADAVINAGISSKGKIIPASMFGTVNFSLKNGSLKDFPPLANIKTFILKNRDMSDVKFAELKNKIDINGTDVYLNRMEIASNVLHLFVEGNYGLNGKNTDILLQVMLSNLNGSNFDQDTAPVNKGVKTKTGSSIWLRAVNGDDGKVKLKLTLSKKMRSKK